jgi:hypothetical protein
MASTSPPSEHSTTISLSLVSLNAALDEFREAVSASSPGDLADLADPLGSLT